MLPPRDISRESDDEWNSIVSLEKMDTDVRHRSPMDLWQVCPVLPSSAIPFHSPSPFLFPSHLWHPSIRPCPPCFTLLPYVPCFTDIHFHATPLYGPASNEDSHDHVISLVGSAFNEGVLLDTDHWWISDKSVPFCHPLLYLSIPQVRSYFHHISDTPPFVPVPLVSPFVLMFPVSLISISMPLWSSHLLHKFSPPPFLSSLVSH